MVSVFLVRWLCSERLLWSRVARDGLTMRAHRSGTTVRVGQRVKATLVRVDLATRQVDLAPEEG